MATSHSIRGPVTIFVIVLVLVITLTVLWNVVLVHDWNRIRELAVTEAQRSGPFHTTFIALGSSLFGIIIVLLSMFGARTFSEILARRRQEGFLASVSHELNSPLQSLKLQAQTLMQPNLEAAARERFLELMVEDVDRLSALIGNVLRAAQIDQGAVTPRREPLLVGDALTALVERVNVALARTNPAASLDLELQADCWVDADRELFRQLLDNLISNALKYSPRDRTHISISLAGPHEGTMVLRVRDRGIGIVTAELKQVFERFYRVEDDDPERSRKGTGLGLSIVKSIAEVHGWSVEASSPGPGQGMTVSVFIPDFEVVVDVDDGLAALPGAEERAR